MALVFVLVSTVPNKERDVYYAANTIRGVIEAYPLSSEYDLLLKVKAEDYNEIQHRILSAIRCISGVIDTKTLFTIKL